jgi:hypothetical protein
MEHDCFTDVFHQLIERFPLRENVNTDTPAAPVAAIGIDFKFNEHESTSVVT